MRFHVPGLPHTMPTTAYAHCAYSQNVRNFARMLEGLGHTVFVYASACPVPPADILTVPYEATDPRWMAHNADCIARIAAQLEPQDVLCLIAGRCQEPIAHAFPTHLAVEYAVGYDGIFAPFCVFPSYAHQAKVYGQRGITDGRFFDAVIPHYYDPAEFPFSVEKEDYLLFIGRLNWDKGVAIAVDVAERTGRRLVVCGSGAVPPGVDYRGVVGIAERGRLMSKAHAVLMPTLYLEPFGAVAVEAQLCGTPVITTDFGAFPETVEQGVTGFRCHYLGEFLDAVGRCGELNPVRIRERAVSKYSLSVVAQQYQSYFERLSLLWGAGWHSEIAPRSSTAEAYTLVPTP
jgi:glycosyltransferase involved in cell wall biosynthesis